MTDESDPRGLPRANAPKTRRSIFDDTAEFPAMTAEGGASKGTDEGNGAAQNSSNEAAAHGGGRENTAPVGETPGRATRPAEPGGSEQAAASRQVDHEPVAHDPVAHDPVSHAQVAHQPGTDRPVTHQPLAHEPATNGPAAPDHGADQPGEDADAWDAAMREAAARDAAARDAAARESSAREAIAAETAAWDPVAQDAAAMPETRDNAMAADAADPLASDAEDTARFPIVGAAGMPPASESPESGRAWHRDATDEVRFWRRRPVLIAGGVLGGLLVLYGAAFATEGGSLARNATVLGVEVGGLSPAEAESRLAADLPPIVDQPIDVQVEHAESTFPLVPSEAGLSIDYAATVDSIPGGSANPFSLVGALFGGGEVAPVPAVDRTTLESAVSAIAGETDTEPVNGGVAFDDGEVVSSAAEIGRAVDITATADQIEQAFFGGEGPHDVPIGPLAATVTEIEPAVTDAEVERAVTEFAEPAMSGPVRVTADEHTIEIEPEMISAALTLTPDDSGRLQPALDADKLAEAASDVLDEVGQPGREATIRIENGRPTVIPHEVGVGISSGALADAILPVLTESGDARAASVEYSEAEPEFTTEDAEALGVKEVVSEFTTRFPHAEYRNVNIGLAASRVNNTLLKPGEEFSLNAIVGERTPANGFAKGGTINGGVLVEDYGGGVSQVATTTYHAAFQAGLEDIYHQPHSIYFSRYPVAQEATVSWGNFDMAFRNDTPYGVLVETGFTASTPGSQGVLTVRIWSTEYFKVETSVSERSNYTDPPTIYNNKDNCIENREGSRGFSITSYRKAWDPDGNLVKDESYPWTYRPNPVVICGEEPDDKDEDDS